MKMNQGNGIIIKRDENGRERAYMMCGSQLVPIRLVDAKGKEINGADNENHRGSYSNR